MNFPISKKWLISGVAVLAVAGTLYGTRGLTGDFWSRNPQQAPQDNGHFAQQQRNDDMSRKAVTLLQPDGITVSRITPDSFTFKASEVPKEGDPQAQLSRFDICVSGKTDAKISQIAFDMHAKANFVFKARLDTQDILTNQKFSTPKTAGEYAFGYDIGKKSYTLPFAKPFVISPGNCSRLYLFGTSIDYQSQWIFPMFKGMKANLPATFYYKAPDGNTVETALSSYSPKTNFGYGTTTFIVPENAASQVGFSPLEDVYSKIQTEKVVVTRLSDPTITVPPSSVASISATKPLLLSMFKICTVGQTDANITGMSVHMIANASFKFDAYLDYKPLLKNSETYFVGKAVPSSYNEKTFDFISDNSFILPAGQCKGLIVSTPSVDAAGAKFILPMFYRVGSNLQSEFVDTYDGKSFVTSLSGSNAQQHEGYGSMVNLDGTKGPLYVDDYPEQTNSSDHTYNTYAYSMIHQLAGAPVKITKATYVLQTNYDKPVYIEFNYTHSKNNIFSHFWPRPQVSTGGMMANLPPNTPFSIPVNMTLGGFEDLETNYVIHTPSNVSATYRLRLVSLDSDTSSTYLFSNPQLFSTGNVFAGKDFDTNIFTLPGQVQPGPLPVYGGDKNGANVNGTLPACPYDDPKKCCDESILDLLFGGDSAKCKKPDGSSYTPDDLKNTGKSDEFKYVASLLHAIRMNAYLQYPNTYTNQQAQDAIAKNGSVELGKMWFTSINAKDAGTFSAKKVSLTITSNNGAPTMTFLIGYTSGPASAMKTYVVQSGVPFDIDVPDFSPNDYVNISISLKEYPVVKQNAFYMDITLNSAQFVNSIDKTKTVPVAVETGTGGYELAKLPWSMGTASFSSGGLFESVDNNIPPPYVKIVDLSTMDNTQELTMNSFCLKALENVSIKSLTFNHITREKSPFSEVTLDVGWANKAILQKNGWSKQQAVFTLSSPFKMNAGAEECFNLKVKGPVEEELESAFFDLQGMNAVSTSSGSVLDVTLKNLKKLSEENPILGTRFDFL